MLAPSKKKKAMPWGRRSGGGLALLGALRVGLSGAAEAAVLVYTIPGDAVNALHALPFGGLAVL